MNVYGDTTPDFVVFWAAVVADDFCYHSRYWWMLSSDAVIDLGHIWIGVPFPPCRININLG